MFESLTRLCHYQKKTLIHQKLSLSLSRKITDYIDHNNGACEVVPAPFSVNLNADDKIYVEPDISVICDKSKIDDRGCNGAPMIAPFQQNITVGIYRDLSINISELLQQIKKTENQLLQLIFCPILVDIF